MRAVEALLAMIDGPEGANHVITGAAVRLESWSLTYKIEQHRGTGILYGTPRRRFCLQDSLLILLDFGYLVHQARHLQQRYLELIAARTSRAKAGAGGLIVD